MRGKIQAICVEGRGPVGAGSWPIEDWAGRPGRPVPLRRRAARICSEVTGTVPHVLRTHRTFPCDAGSPGAARRFVRNAGQDWGFDTDDVELVVTELATNAVQHAGSQYSVELSFEGATATVEVSDASGRWPARKTPRVMESGGRGLLIVDTLCRRWGVRQGHRAGKVVWADIDVGVLERPSGDEQG